jgi:UDP-2-acetamido-3-amino-2,3-dideoxy-glucuronate N-acetyltransferase
MSVFIHPTAEVDPEAHVEDGVQIWNWTKVREGARIGAGCHLGQGVYVDHDVEIGTGCKIQNGVSVYHGVTIADRVFVGPNATFVNDRRPRADSPDWKIEQTTILEGASICANATVVCGVTIGKFSMVAAGAIVTHDVPDHALVVGQPARVIDYVTESGERLHRNLSGSVIRSDQALGAQAPTEVRE